MKYLKKYTNFIKENNLQDMIEIARDVDILESIITDSDTLLNSIQAKELDLFTTFNINPDEYDRGFSIEKIYDDTDFNKSLKEMDLNKTKIEESEDNETFIKNTLDIKFFLVYEQDQSALDQPQYIIFQSKQTNENEWSDVKLYSVNDDINNFYDKLTNKTIELHDGDKTYIYFTSNSGNNWQLQNVEMADGTYKELLDNEDVKMILQNRDVSVTIVS